MRLPRNRTLVLLTIALMSVVGCSTAPTGSYVREDRSTYNVIAPKTLAFLDGTQTPDQLSADTKQSITIALDKWDGRVAGAPDSDYVRGDRATNKSISPFVRQLLDGSLPLSDVDADERQSKRNVIKTWDLRICGEEGTSG